MVHIVDDDGSTTNDWHTDSDEIIITFKLPE